MIRHALGLWLAFVATVSACAAAVIGLNALDRYSHTLFFCVCGALWLFVLAFAIAFFNKEFGGED
jgi:hypothetical protein